MTVTETALDTRVPQRSWIGVVALAIYVAFAAGVANLLTLWLSPGDEIADLALSHFPVLLPLIVGGVVFVKWAGWSQQVWHTPASFETRPRRLWMLAIPVLLLTNSIVVLTAVPSSAWSPVPVLVIALAMALVGIGEELYVRGILRTSIRARHGETFTLLATSLLFGLAHTLGYAIDGVPLPLVVFQVFGTALSGALLYAAFRATGRLWVPMVLHTLDDFALHLGGDEIGGNAATATQAVGVIGTVLWVLAAVFLISCIRQDLAARRARLADTA